MRIAKWKTFERIHLPKITNRATFLCRTERARKFTRFLTVYFSIVVCLLL